jgi:hypothetical protein
MNHFRAQHFYTSIIFDHLLFLGGFNIFNISNYYEFWDLCAKNSRAALLPFA